MQQRGRLRKSRVHDNKRRSVCFYLSVPALCFAPPFRPPDVRLPHAELDVQRQSSCKRRVPSSATTATLACGWPGWRHFKKKKWYINHVLLLRLASGPPASH